MTLSKTGWHISYLQYFVKRLTNIKVKLWKMPRAEFCQMDFWIQHKLWCRKNPKSSWPRKVKKNHPRSLTNYEGQIDVHPPCQHSGILWKSGHSTFGGRNRDSAVQHHIHKTNYSCDWYINSVQVYTMVSTINYTIHVHMIFLFMA